MDRKPRRTQSRGLETPPRPIDRTRVWVNGSLGSLYLWPRMGEQKEERTERPGFLFCGTGGRVRMARQKFSQVVPDPLVSSAEERDSNFVELVEKGLVAASRNADDRQVFL